MRILVCLALLSVVYATTTPEMTTEMTKVEGGTYAVYFPKHIRPGCPIVFCAQILQSDNPISIKTTLKSDDWMAMVTVVLSEGQQRTAAIEMIPYDYDGSTSFIATSIGTDINTGKMVFNETTNKYDIQFQKKSLSIFIQTDKAIYQPSQMIKFRAVVTTSDLLPFEGSATYKLIDPNGNTIIMEKDALLVKGVVGSEFMLGRYSTLGQWRIVYTVFGFEESLMVSVEEYKLPKFKVEVKTDQSFLHPGSQELTGEVTAKYTFGQPVKGNATVEFTINRYYPRNRIPDKIVQKYPEFDGSGTFNIPAADIERLLKWNPKRYSQPLKIVAFVTDKTSGDTFNATTTVDLQRLRLKVEAVAKPSNIKPGLPYVAYLKISEQDGTLLTAEDREDLGFNVTMTYSYSYDPVTRRWPESKSSWKILEVGEDGIAVLEIIAEPDKFRSVSFDVKIESYPVRNTYWTSWSANRFESPSDSYLQLSTDDTSLEVGDTARITIDATEIPEMDDGSMRNYWCMILARGKLILKQLVKPTTYETSEHSYQFYYTFDITAEMSPSVFFVCWYYRPDGEIVGDTVKLTVQASMSNEVVMMTSTDKTDAGMPVSITVKAAPDSFVGLRAIDQSVLLLKSGNDITQDKVFQDLDQYGVQTGYSYRPGRRWYWPYPVGGADIKEVFDNSGVIVLTDATLYSKRPDFPIYFGGGFGGGIRPVFAMARRPMLTAVAAPMMFKGDSAPQTAASSASQIVTRSYFPESWIWSDAYTGDNGSTIFYYDTPDTITTWEISSFAVSSIEGLGVAKDTSKITVFRNFFISLNLPPTMIRGEVLIMRTTLFNYFDSDLVVTVTLNENEWYDLVIIGEDRVAAGPMRIITVPAQDSKTISFPIKFKKVGTAKISVTARSARAGDAVERTLVVKPEGIPKLVAQSTIVDRKDENEDDSVTLFDVVIPADAVEGSVYAKFSVSGNVLGSALSNLGNLLQMPSGCGEQTMLSFAPDVFISLYLSKVGELEGEVKQKSKSHIQQGYQNELRYQRDDGSFSAFGSEDRAGSTWLTAFVVKSFIAARQLNPDLIEERVVNRAIRFILNQQNKDGSFEEPGRVIHKDMQGGVSSKETLAAYVLIALAEGRKCGEKIEDEKVEEAIAKVRGFLERRVSKIRDTYSLAIVTYALSVVCSPKVVDLLNVLDARAVEKGNLKYWEKEDAGASSCKGRGEYCPFDDSKASAASIEMTAYILMVYVKQGKQLEVMPIVRWLVEQRNSFGGYRSTQDTVMAIQALSTIAGIFADRPIDLTLSVSHTGQSSFREVFSITKDNTIVLQMADLPSKPGQVVVRASGVGFADVQVNVVYNLPAGPVIDEPFEVDVTVNKKKDIVVFQVCTKINEKRKEVIKETGMGVITAKLPSGYTIDDKEATQQNKPQLKFVELVGQDVSGYFDELKPGLTICMTLNMFKIAEVSEIKPQLLKVFDYYSPERESIRQYKPESASICELCGIDCVGCKPIVEPPPTDVPMPPPPGCWCSDVPCPDFSDGLYYDLGSHISYMMEQYASPDICVAPQGTEDSEKYSGLPGTLLNGVNQYIVCEQPVFSRLVQSEDGFTIAFLVHPTELNQGQRYTIFSLGVEKTRPYIWMEKKPKVNKYWMKMKMNGYEMTVQNLYLYDIPVDIWTHVVVTYDGKSKAKVYINGMERGKVKTRETTTAISTDNISMRWGRSHTGNFKSRGNFKGLMSSLDIWLNELSAEQIMDYYNCYKKIMFDTNPLLTVDQVYHVVPMDLTKCFTRSYSASDLKKRKGELRTSCPDAPIEPILPILDIPE